MPALAQVAGLKVVFADVDPSTFTLDPAALERAITPATRAVVPTHLYGLPCDMDAIMAIARRHDLRVIEDCAHALGATYEGRPVGTIGDAGFFSFQTLKPLNCYGGGMALVADAAVAARVRALAEREPWPDEKRIDNRLLVGRLQRIFIKPWVFTISAFPILWVSSLIGANPDVYLWEEIRSLDPLPDVYTERFPNVQAAIGLAALDQLDEWTERTRRHARVMDQALGDLPGITVPQAPADRTHVYYQYCVYGPQRDELVVKCVRRGIDIETLHVDVCSDLDLFAGAAVEPPGRLARTAPPRRCRSRCTPPSPTSRRRGWRGSFEACSRNRRRNARLPVDLHRGDHRRRDLLQQGLRGRDGRQAVLVGVLVAGALGGATGDQLWFYILRGRIHWLDRYPWLARHRDSVSARVHSHETAIILVSRFLPGLRTAIPIACAYANVRPLKFSALNLVSAFAWAGAIMLFVKTGSSTLAAFGLTAWWGPLIPAVIVILFFRWLGRSSRRDKGTEKH